jgi:NADH:ubiquinone oxidoreductase subunit 4 (subunit M)
VLVPGITAGYFVWMLRRVLAPPREKVIGYREAPTYTLITLAIFLIPLLIFGLYPAPLLSDIIPAVQMIPP